MLKIFALLLMTTALHAGGIPGIWPPQPMPGESHVVFEGVVVNDIEVHAEQVAQNVRVYMDPKFSGFSYFVVVRDGEILWVDHISRMGPPQNPHFGTPDELFMDCFVPQGLPDSELPHEFKVYHTPFAPNFSLPSILVHTNTEPASSVAVSLVDWEIIQDDVLLPEDGTPVPSVMSVLADDTANLMGVSFAWKYDASRMEIVSIESRPEWNPSFSSGLIYNEATTVSPGVVQQAGIAFYGSIKSFNPFDSLPVSPLSEVPIITMELAARPGVPVGEVEYNLWDFQNGSGEVVSVASQSAHTEIVYYDYSLGPNAMTHYDSPPDAPGSSFFSRWQKPSISIGELASVTAGDCNQDGQRDMSDVIGMLGFLFGGQAVSCVPAVDMDMNQVLNVSDPIYLLANLFQGGPGQPECGVETFDCGASCP